MVLEEVYFYNKSSTPQHISPFMKENTDTFPSIFIHSRMQTVSISQHEASSNAPL